MTDYTHKLRKRFVKDNGLKIQVLQSPYFEYFLELYNEKYNTQQLYKEFMDLVESFDNPELFLQNYNNIQKNIIDKVKAKESFQEFNNNRLEKYNTSTYRQKSKLFHLDNDSETFISIDLQKANFYAIKHYNADIVDGCETYKDWLENNGVDTAYLINSKYLRQYIFGHINPKKQMKIQKYVMSQLIELLDNHNIVKEADIMSISPDEITFKDSDRSIFADVKNFINQTIPNEHKESSINEFNFHIEKFQLKKVGVDEKLGYVKEFEDGKVEFKCVPDIFMPQAYKYHYKEPLNENDCVFYYEGMLARLMNPLY